jgi:hypothetical protein
MTLNCSDKRLTALKSVRAIRNQMQGNGCLIVSVFGEEMAW